MLYFIIRPIVRLTFRIFFSKIHLHHLDRIPRDRPVLISSNHPSAFLEACLLATHFPKSLHFLVRGDIFINKYVIWILKQVHLSPIYRVSDGFRNLRANEATFNECHHRLKNNEIIVVYAEGNTTQEKRLRPIQKGLARIAFGALDRFPEMDLCIVPLGVNYTHPNDFRSEVMIEVGEPIELKNYYKEFNADNIKAIAELTQRVESEMKPLVIHVNKDEYLPAAEKLFLINKSKSRFPFWPVIDRSGVRFVLDKKSADEINQMSDDERAGLLKKTESITGERKPGGIFSLIAFFGKWVNYLPFYLGEKIAKSAAKRIEFYASVLVGTTMFLYIFYFLLIGLLAHLIGFSTLEVWTILILTGILYLYYRHQIERIELNSIKMKATGMGL
ncbi:MAG: 1-acyl-sn-glycerol-3-phosphate acyltransferase [Saprospiraceae bacterium]